MDLCRHAVTALYLNVFVLIVQSFQRVRRRECSGADSKPSGRLRSPTLVTLLVFVALAGLAVKNFR